MQLLYETVDAPFLAGSELSRSLSRADADDGVKVVAVDTLNQVLFCSAVQPTVISVDIV